MQLHRPLGEMDKPRRFQNIVKNYLEAKDIEVLNLVVNLFTKSAETLKHRLGKIFL